MEIKSIIEYANGFMTQAFAFGGEDGMEKCDPSVKYRASIQNYLIDTGDEVILVDTGVPADFKDPEYNENAPLFNGERISEYMVAFNELGYKKEDVTKILLTHKHIDHSGEIKLIKKFRYLSIFSTNTLIQSLFFGNYKIFEVS